MSAPAAERPTDDTSSEPASRVNLTVLIGSSSIILAVTAWALLAPVDASAGLGTLVGWATDWFGWFYVLLATSVLVFVVVIAVSRFALVGPNPGSTIAPWWVQRISASRSSCSTSATFAVL